MLLLQTAQEPGQHVGGNQRLSPRGAPYRLHHLGRGLVLAQVAGDAGLDGRLQDRLLFIARQDHDLGLGTPLLDGGRRLDPRAVRHVHVEQHDVGPERAGRVDRLLDRPALADHFDVGLASEDGG